MKHLIEEFATSDLFGRENYEFYARVTGRVLRVQGEWICSFQYPPSANKNQMFGNHLSALEQYYFLGEQLPLLRMLFTVAAIQVDI